MISTLHTNRSMTLAVKYFAPMIIFATSGVLVLGGRPKFAVLLSRAIFEAPFVLLGFFLLTVAHARVSKEGIEYLRFFRWKRIPFGTIKNYGESWLPGIGFLKTCAFVPPWGKIYFVTLRPLFVPRNEGFLHLIGNFSHGTHAHPTAEQTSDSTRASRTCLLVGLVGFFITLVAGFFTSGFSSGHDPNLMPHWVGIATGLLGDALRWPWVMAICGILLLEIFRLRFRGQALIASLVLGSLLAFTAARLLH